MAKRKDTRPPTRDATPADASDITAVESPQPAITAPSEPTITVAETAIVAPITPPMAASDVAPSAAATAEPAPPLNAVDPSEAPPIAIDHADAPTISKIEMPDLGSTAFRPEPTVKRPDTMRFRPIPPLKAANSDSGPSADGAEPNAVSGETPRWRQHRFALLAASVAVAAAIGGLAGSLAMAGLLRAFGPMPTVAAAAPAKRGEDARLRQMVTKLSAELAALRTSVDSSSRNAHGQFGKLAERIERAERTLAEPSAKLARIAETIDKLEKRAAAPASASTATASTSIHTADTTGTLGQLRVSGASGATIGALPPPPPVSAPATVASAEPTPPAAKPAVVEGWVLRDIYEGRALVEGGRHGNLYEVGPGSNLPGIGRVEAIKRQDGRWVVVTARGLITAFPPPRNGERL